MQVYQRAQHLMRMMEPSFTFSSESDFTDCINVLTQAVNRHNDKAITLMPELFNIFSEMMSNRMHFSLSDYAEMLSVITKCYSYLPDNDNNYNQQVLTCIILTLSNISPDVSKDWSHPVECKKDSDAEIFEAPEISICREILEKVGDFVLKMGYKNARVYFAPIFIKYTQFNTDWRQKYGALMVASNLTEEVEELSQVEIYINASLPQLGNSHPKMRFAALEVLGQIGISVKPDFQEKYFEIIVPELLKLLWDNTPQVVSHVFACLSNFLSDFQQSWKVEAIINDLLNPLIHYLKSDSPYMQQCALDSISCLGGISSSLGTNAGILIQACGQALQHSLQRKQPYIIQAAFQSLSLILCCQDQNQIGCFVPHFVESLLSNITLINDQKFLEIWEQLCMKYKNFVDLNATNIVPILMQKILKMVKGGIDQNAINALASLSETTSAFQQNLAPYFQQLCKFCTSIFQNTQNSYIIRNEAADVIVKLFINTYKRSDEEKYFNEGMNLMQFLITTGDDSIKQQGAPQLLLGVLGGFLQLITPLEPKLDQHALLAISDKMMTYKLRIEELISQEPEQPEQIVPLTTKCDVDSSYQEFSEEIEDFNFFDIIELIPNIYAKMMKISNPTNRQVLINIVIPQISFTVGKDDGWKGYALNMALSLVEECQYADLIAYWGDLMSLFSSFIAHGSYQLRNLSAYGTGLIIKKTPANLIVGENVIEWIQNLWNSFSAPFDPDQEKNNINHCKENVVAAVGKLLRTCGNNFPHILTSDIYKKWLQFLPLRQDKQECDEQHAILLQILQSNPTVLMSNDFELKRILEIIANFILLKNFEVDSQVLSDTKKCINDITTWQLFKHCSDTIWNSLSIGQKRALAKLMEHS